MLRDKQIAIFDQKMNKKFSFFLLLSNPWIRIGSGFTLNAGSGSLFNGSGSGFNESGPSTLTITVVAVSR
jgi:hypothetical protein